MLPQVPGKVIDVDDLATHEADTTFAELICAGPDWLRAEFSALVPAGFGVPPAPPRVQPRNPPAARPARAVGYGKKQVKDAPSIGTNGELPAGDEEAIFKHYGLTYEPGAGGERRLARR
jgi:hypothetical protein